MTNTPVRAAAEGMPEISRRYFLRNTAAAAATAVVATPVVAKAGENPDAEIFRLVAEYEKANAEVDRVGHIFDRYEEIFIEGKPERPVNGRPPVSINDDTTIAEMRAQCAPCKAHEAAVADWEAAVERFRIDSGFAEADATYKAALDAATDLVQQVLETPAYTPHGMLEKIRLADGWGEADDCLEHLKADIRRMAGEAQS